MKQFTHSFICILICLVPTFLAGQALQVQNQLQGIHSPTERFLANSNQLTDPPLLRISNIGSSGQDGVSIELIPLSLVSTGPMLLFDSPVPGTPASGAMRLLPNVDGAKLKISNIGSSGQDGVRLSVVPPPVHNSFFDVFFDVNTGTETHQMGDPDFDLLRITTYDKATPKLLDRVSSNSIGLDSFFDVFYDLSLATHGVGFGNYPNNVCLSTMFDPMSPKLTQKISSDLPTVHSFFDITYDLGLLRETHRIVILPPDPDFDLIVVREWDKSTPKLKESIKSADPSLANSFFDISYDLNARAHKIMMEDLIVSNYYHSAIPKLQQVISSGNPLWADSFFDITYDLSIGKQTTKHRGLVYAVQYRESDWDFSSRLSSEDPAVPGFFDITYDLELGTQKTQINNQAYSVAASEPSTICWKFESMPPGASDFFDICYDMELGKIKTEYNNLKYSQTLIDASKSEVTIESALPAVQGFFDITYDIGLPDIQSHSTRAGLLGAAPMEMRYEYDALNRKIRQIGTDTQNGSTLSLDWLLSPSGSSLLITNKLQVQGTVSTPGSGPLVLEDNLMVVGATHQISGNVTINGNLQVNGVKMFKIDHPLDPDNKYLVHSCVESPDMMNIYNGNAVTDEQGYVTINLPGYFEALNAEFRYQLTCIGQFAQAIVEQKIKDNQFVIRTDKPNVEVSWQVTGIRHDPAALQQQYKVEVEKTIEEKESRLCSNQ